MFAVSDVLVAVSQIISLMERTRMRRDSSYTLSEWSPYNKDKICLLTDLSFCWFPAPKFDLKTPFHLIGTIHKLSLMFVTPQRHWYRNISLHNPR